MNIAFFELEDWEKEIFLKEFPDAQYSSTPLTLQNIQQYNNIDVLCTFIYSQITAEIMQNLPNLKFIATQSTGFDHINLPL
jgi:D-lactate dehydrogenase